MDSSDSSTLKRILVEEMQKYTGEGLNDVATLTVNEAAQMYAVIDVATIQNKRVVGTVLVARVVDTQIIIDLDLHDKLLVDALKARGVPEAQITLAYQNDLLSAS
jgi:hypothetical protein